jgi:monoamine oxidase
MPPAELRKRRLSEQHDPGSGGLLSRADFLRGAGALGAAAMLGPGALAACGGETPRRSARARVAIVGGGIAGLTAALTLDDAGVASKVYEDSPDRIGGRMHSFRAGYWEDDQMTEWAGELIDTDMSVMRGLAQRFSFG